MTEISFGIEFEMGFKTQSGTDTSSIPGGLTASFRNGWARASDTSITYEVKSRVFTNGRADYLHTFLNEARAEFFQKCIQHGVVPQLYGKTRFNGSLGGHTHIGRLTGIPLGFAERVGSYVRAIYPMLAGIVNSTDRAVQSGYCCVDSEGVTSDHFNELSYNSDWRTLELRVFDSAHPVVMSGMLALLIPFAESAYERIERDNRFIDGNKFLKVIKIPYNEMRTKAIRGNLTASDIRDYLARYLIIMGRDLDLASLPIATRRVIHLFLTGQPIGHHVGRAVLANGGIDWEGNIPNIPTVPEGQLKKWLADYLPDDSPTTAGIRAGAMWTRGTAGRDTILYTYGTRMFNALERVATARTADELTKAINGNRKYRIFAVMVHERLAGELAREEARLEAIRERERMARIMRELKTEVQHGRVSIPIYRLSEVPNVDRNQVAEKLAELTGNKRTAHEYIEANERFLVAVAPDNSIIGTVAVRMSTGYISELFVADGMRGVGIGRKLVARASEMITGERANTIPYALVAVDNTASISAFGRAGFQRVDYPQSTIARAVMYLTVPYNTYTASIPEPVITDLIRAINTNPNTGQFDEDIVRRETARLSGMARTMRDAIRTDIESITERINDSTGISIDTAREIATREILVRMLADLPVTNTEPVSTVTNAQKSLSLRAIQHDIGRMHERTTNSGYRHVLGFIHNLIGNMIQNLRN